MGHLSLDVLRSQADSGSTATTSRCGSSRCLARAARDPEVLLIRRRGHRQRASSWKLYTPEFGLRVSRVFRRELRGHRRRLRGLHFQRQNQPASCSRHPRHVFVLPRTASRLPTSGHVGGELTAEARTLMYIPSWCATVFVLTDQAEVVYTVE